ncbi:glycosyltransferase family 4 protein [Imperialibacter roseus]|uniref:Glycosyltransferase family 4 protein n=1 Tax=Imperialibacter roseus TaxID=1324217 RepID=A0ABZ0IKN4_9BACT|nr:glycosyltransferase family 4 protein [Imperialibacter roseus]WOK05578.1 glycosyltransferase family 4 protein [Imperialibacter roseus]
MKRFRIIYIVSRVNSARQFELVADGVRNLGVEIEFILLNSKVTPLETYLKKRGFGVTRLPLSGRLSLLYIFLALFGILLVKRPRIIHTHLFEANLTGLFAGWIAGVPTRIHTRHHSIIHHQSFPGAVKWDKLCNWLSTHVVAPSQVIADVLTRDERLNSSKVQIVHHGFDLTSFNLVCEERVESVREKHNIPKSKLPVVGCIARYTEWKGVQFVILAFQKTLQKYPDALLVLCNARGDYASVITEHLSKLPSFAYREVLFEEDIEALYQCFNIFVHVPTGEKEEAFGQIYIEAMAAEIPSVLTISGIANEFVRHGENAFVVDYKDEKAIAEAVDFLLSNPKQAKKLASNARKDVNSKFSIESMNLQLMKLYFGEHNKTKL